MASRSLLASLAKSVNALLKNKGGARSKQKKKRRKKSRAYFTEKSGRAAMAILEDRQTFNSGGYID